MQVSLFYTGSAYFILHNHLNRSEAKLIPFATWSLAVYHASDNSVFCQLCLLFFNPVSRIIRDSFGFTLLRSVIGPLSQPIRFKSETNHDLLACVIPRCRQFSSHWLLKLFYFLLIGHYE